MTSPQSPVRTTQRRGRPNKWLSGQTIALRVPHEFQDILLKFARYLDQGHSLEFWENWLNSDGDSPPAPVCDELAHSDGDGSPVCDESSSSTEMLSDLYRQVQQLEQVNRQLTDKVKVLEGSLSDYEELKAQFLAIKSEYAFLSADARFKQRMYDILHEVIEDTSITQGKMKSFVKLALVAGRGEFCSEIDGAYSLLKRAVAADDVKEGNRQENEALARVGQKPRRAKRVRRRSLT